MSEMKEILNFFDKEIDEILSLAAELKFDSGHVLLQHVIGLYGSIIEMSRSIKVLYVNGHFTPIPVVLRTMLEAFVDLTNLCKDPKYGYSLTINSKKELLKFLNAAQDNQNVYTIMSDKNPNLDKDIADFKGQIEELKADGIKGINIKDKFKKADMLDEYLMIYNRLCACTHNDIQALRARHLVLDKNSFSIEFFKKEDTQSMYESFGIASELLLRATYEIHCLLKSGKEKELQSLRDDLNEIRGDA